MWLTVSVQFGGCVVERHGGSGSVSGPPCFQGFPFMFTMASGGDRLPLGFLVDCEPPVVVGPLIFTEASGGHRLPLAVCYSLLL